MTDPLILEAEEFFVRSPGWTAIDWSENYFAASSSNTFLSRQAALCAPEQCATDSIAELTVSIPTAGRYVLLARYEAAFRFETQFRVELEQKGRQLLRHSMGTRDSLRIWAFGKGLTEEVEWPGGANENMIWEGHDTAIDLTTGPLLIRLIAGQQPGPAARRIIDALILTTNITGVADRIKHENGLPLDGWLTQAGDVFIRPRNHGAGRVTFKVWSGSERSPGPLHQREWQPLEMAIDPDRTPSWIEVGHLLDTLNNGSWRIEAGYTNSHKIPRTTVEFGLAKSDGTIESIRKIDVSTNHLNIIYRGALRYNRRLVTAEEAAQDFLQAMTSLPAAKTTLREVYGKGPPALLTHLGIHDSSSLMMPNHERVTDVELGSPRGSAQMLEWPLDILRCPTGAGTGIVYVANMPIDDPGTTPSDWRRRLYANLAHGIQGIDIGSLYPAPLLASAGGFESVKKWGAPLIQVLDELRQCQDFLLTGRIQKGEVAFFIGETGKRWNDQRPPFGAAQRCLATVLRHQQIALDVINETSLLRGDLKPYKTLYLTDHHLDSSIISNIMEWVDHGGILFATAGAGWWDENNLPFYEFRRQMGISARDVLSPLSDAITFEKQDLPFLKPMEWVYATNSSSAMTSNPERMPVFGARARFTSKTAEVIARFSDKSPAMVRKKIGRGEIITCAFLPGLTYFKPALPLRPVDRGGNDQSYDHFLPTQFDWRAASIISLPLGDISRRVIASSPVVETAVIESPHGYLIPVINWTSTPQKNLLIRFNSTETFSSVELLSHIPVQVSTNNGVLECTFDLTVADALMLRRP